MTPVNIYGFTEGIDNISITSGTINRVSIKNYYKFIDILLLQTDVSARGGNSGGPVVAKGEIIGTLNGGSNDITFCIPSFFTKYLLELYESNYKCCPIIKFPIKYQALNDVIRIINDLNGSISGVYVNKISTKCEFELGDIICEIDGNPLDNMGRLPISTFLDTEKNTDIPVDLNFYISIKKENSVIPVTIYRAGKKIKINVKLVAIKEYIPVDNKEFLKGDMALFVPLSTMGFQELHKSYSTNHIVRGYRYNKPNIMLVESLETERMNEILAKPAIVKHVNGESPRDFGHFVKLMGAKSLKIKFRKCSDILFIDNSNIQWEKHVI
jgi:hypothetical protein